MKRAMQSLLSLIVTLIVSWPLVGWAQQDPQPPQLECEGRALRVKAVGVQHMNRNAVNFTRASAPGTFDPTPLLQTEITVNGPNLTCLVAHFNAYVSPTDNHIVSQVRVDGVPMEGHAFADRVGFPVPPGVLIVSDPNTVPETFFDPPRMAAANFFMQVGPGPHTVEVLIAACCGDPMSEEGVVSIHAAVLTLEYM